MGKEDKNNNRVGFKAKWRKADTIIEHSEKILDEPSYEKEDIADTHQTAVKAVKGTLQSISVTINNVDLTSEEMSKCAVMQASEMQVINTKVANIGKAVDNTFASVDVLANGYERVMDYSSQGNVMLAELNNISEETKESVDAVRKQTDATNISAAEIRKATASIAGIAYQTNLLSLNASIEAARSGESGKGFAVVANEIRKLAEQSKTAAAQITRIVDMLIENSNSSVEIMTKVTDYIKRQNEKLNSTSEAFEGLGREMSGVSGAIEDITLAMVELEGLKDEVIGSVSNLAAISEENAASSEEISASIQELNQNIENCINTFVKL